MWSIKNFNADIIKLSQKESKNGLRLNQLTLVTFMAVDISFLYCPKNTPLTRLSSHFGGATPSGNINVGEGIKVLEILESVNIYTYGQLLEFAQHNNFSDLPGIGSHIAERIHQFIEFMESGNKGSLAVLFLEMSKRFPNLRNVAEKHIREQNK